MQMVVKPQENLTGNEGSTNKRKIRKNISEQHNKEEVSILTSYIDNPQMVLGLAQDPRTPAIIVEQIALNPVYSEARNCAVKAIVNDDQKKYSEKLFEAFLKFWEDENVHAQVSAYEARNAIQRRHDVVINTSYPYQDTV